MKNCVIITLTIGISLFLFSTAWTRSQPDGEGSAQPQPGGHTAQSAATPQPAALDQPQSPQQSGPTEAAAQPAKADEPQELEPQQKKPTRREPVKIVDIDPESATHREAEPLAVKFKRLSALRIRADGALIACDADEKVIKVFSPEGEPINTIELDFTPEAMNLAADGTIYCGGKGTLAKLDATGGLVKTVTVPDEVAPTPTPKPAESRASTEEESTNNPPAEKQIDPTSEQGSTLEHAAENTVAASDSAVGQEQAAQVAPATTQPSERQDESPETGEAPKSQQKAPPARRRKKVHPKRISGIAVTDRHVFVAFGSGWSTGSKSKLYRFDLELGHPKCLAEGLRGCCQRCDIETRNDVLYLAENSAHRVVLYDREGNVLNKWGERGRDDLETFGACCNPMNLCFDDSGFLYTSESGLGRVKRYTIDGRFVDLVGYVGTERFWHGSGLAASCSNIAIAVTPDGTRVYVMDYKNNQVRVLQKKTESDEVEPAPETGTD